MVIVGGTFEVEPTQRAQFIASRDDMMRTSRGEPGCLEYVFCADPIEPNRVVLFERWEVSRLSTTTSPLSAPASDRLMATSRRSRRRS